MTQQDFSTTGIIRQDIQPLATLIPQALSLNQQSVERCQDACADLLLQIEADGMNSEYAKQAATIITKSRNTVKLMMERRQPITVAFDELRKQFTTLENAIDPKKEGTMPNKLQQIHNEYAAKLLKEKQEAERKAYEEQQARQLKEQFKAETEHHYVDSFNTHLTQQKERLEKMFTETTLKDYDFKKQSITYFPTTFNVNNWYNTIGMYFTIDTHIPSAEQKQINLIARETFVSRFMDTYTSEITTLRDSLIEKMPGKYQELKELEKLSQEERLKAEAEIAERERLKKEQEASERKQKEETEKARQEAERQAKAAADLFAAAAATAQPTDGYNPKVKVTKKIQLASADGILPIITFWWSKEGKDMTVDELKKIFHRQVTFAEKCANKDNELIESPAIKYIDEVKAK